MRACLGGLAACLLLSHTAAASVDTITIQSRDRFHTSRVGPYVKITGTFVGSLDPSEPIPGLARVPRRPDGRVEYASDFIILAPDPPTSGNRVMLFDVENRGRPVTHGLYNSPNERLVSTLEIGNGFLEDTGYAIVIASWQEGQGITLPSARCSP